MLLNKIIKYFFKFLSTIKIYPYPMFIVIDPGSYDITGQDIREILKCLKPGDILLRSYENYLDGMLIPGFFSHVGFYCGNNMVVHATSKGVYKEDILTFVRCDHLSILRFRNITNDEIKLALKNADESIGSKYDFRFNLGDDQYYCSELVWEKIYSHKQSEFKFRPHTVKYLWGLIKKQNIIIPDDFLSSPALEMVYRNSKSYTKINKAIIDQMCKNNKSN